MTLIEKDEHGIDPAQVDLTETPNPLPRPPPYTELAKDDAGNGAIPWDGQIFLIRHRDSHQILSVDDRGNGRLSSFDDGESDPTKYCQWQCVEKNGWFGFKHMGKFLGRGRGIGGFSNLLAESKQLGNNQVFGLRQHPSGGYQIMALNRWTYDKIDVGQGGQKLVLVKDGGALWDFVSV
ncbi:hypothetical protein BX600DRAFT_475515 [Xylariales sp. PMI_506]|nr:hypothetical protein BX600DRAFT_475515 [Xylariales sp. PMI_506]